MRFHTAGGAIAPPDEVGTVSGMTVAPDRTDLDDLASPGTWVFEGYETVSHLLASSPGAASVELVAELGRLVDSVEEGFDAYDAVQACFLVGATLAGLYAAATSPARRIALLEAVVTLQDSIEGLRLDGLGGTNELDRTAVSVLRRVAQMQPAGISAGEHYGDLLLAAAAMIAHLRYA